LPDYRKETTLKRPNIGIQPTTAVVTRAHKSNYPHPIEFRKNDELQIGESDTEYEGWVRVTTRDGNRGWAPVQYIDIGEGCSTGRANHAYCAVELDVQPGEQVKILNELNSWYWVENSRGCSGWVPVLCVTSVSHAQEDQND